MDFSVQVGGYSLGRPRSVPRTESIGTDVQVGETQSTEGATTTGSLTAKAPEILLFQRKRGYVLSATIGLHVGKFKGITLRSVFLVIEPSILAYRYFWKPILQKKTAKSFGSFFLFKGSNQFYFMIFVGWLGTTHDFYRSTLPSFHGEMLTSFSLVKESFLSWFLWLPKKGSLV